MDEYLTPKDISVLLGIGMTKTYEIINKKEFPKIRIGKIIRVPRTEFEKYMKKQITC